MKKKFLSILLVLTCLCMIFALAACIQDEEDAAFKVTVKEGSGYTVTGLNADGYKEGAQVTFKVEITDATKQLKEVVANEQALTAQSDGSYKFTMPGKNAEISVVLEDKAPEKFEVTVKEGSGYSVKGISADGYAEGAEVTFNVEITDATKQLKEVVVNEQALTAQSDGSYKFTMPGKDIEISVVLEDVPPVLFKVTVKEGLGGGYSVKGLNAEGYAEGSEVTFKVEITDATKQLKEVVANEQALTADADGNYKFAMPAKNAEISIVLEDKIFEVTVKEGSGYTVQGISTDGYKAGAEVSFKVTVTDETKQLKEVSANEQALTADADGNYKLTMSAKNVEISVVLEDKLPVLSLSETSLALNVQAENSASVTATVTPSADAHELEWKSNDENVATVTADGRTAEITAVGKGTTTISVSFKGLDSVEAVEITVTVINVRPWSEAEENAMKEHLYGVVLFPTEVEDMEATWDARYGQITIEGGWAEDNQLAEYASQYTAEDGWADVSYMYSVPAGTAYFFEKEVEVSDNTRYVRVCIYATADGGGEELATEGLFFITAFDPYLYEWPAEYLQECLKAVLSTEVIPAVSAHHYSIEDYAVIAYFDSAEADGGYGAILTAAGYAVEELEGYYIAVSPDEMFVLAYAYEDGILLVQVMRNSSDEWPEKAVANAFKYYQAVNPNAFVLPEFEGDGVSFVFADGLYNKYWINEGKERDMYGTITASSSTQALTDAYTQKLLDNGWVKVGNDGMYVKPIEESDQVNKITVTYSEQYGTTITVYYFSIKDPTVGWDDDLIKKNIAFYKYMTDTLPEYNGTITAFSVDKDTVYLTVPEEDFADLLDTYKQILLDAGFVLEGTTTWNQQYVSPNRQYGLKPSVRTSQPNTIQIYFSSEMPSAWNNERIKDSLQLIGSSLESIPMFESETSFLCLCEIKKNYDTTPTSDYLKITISASVSGESLVQADLDTYVAKLVAAEGWTQDANNSNKFVGSDGTTITVSLSYGSITISIMYVAAA